MAADIGKFFLFLGTVVMIIYFSTDFAGAPVFSLFFLSIFFILLGIHLIRKNRPPPQDSQRFSLVRRLLKKGQRDEKRS